MRPTWSPCPTLLLALCLLLHCATSCCSPAGLADLPAPSQSASRLLAAITVSDNTTAHFISKQLQSYTEACELGFEVHVVLITFPTVWDAADTLLFQPASRFYCLRLHMLLPVVVASYPLDSTLAHRHRHVFSRFVHTYDLFLSQEHDMDIRPRHLRYWTRWRRIFQHQPSVPRSDRPIVPGFLRHEVSTRRHDPNTWHHPAPLLHLDPPFSVLLIGNTSCFAPHKSYPGFYLLDRQLLLAAMSKRAWTTDSSKHFNEFNVHHQAAWQWHYFHQAIPLGAMHSAMVHHTSDRYTNTSIAASSKYNASQFRRVALDGVDVAELSYLLTHCMGQRWDASKLPYPYPSLQSNNTDVKYGWCRGWIPDYFKPANASGPSHAKCVRVETGPAGLAEAAPCAQCTGQGKGAALMFVLSGPTLAARPTKPTGLFVVDVTCIEGLAAQEAMPCHEPGCDDYHVNATDTGTAGFL